ncbi:hypothetical protein C8R43DRAFT_661224 [Mycena crocata]|nr:hypothetical protein C8R43DRAFT_661224 [Mycena crocata]
MSVLSFTMSLLTSGGIFFGSAKFCEDFAPIREQTYMDGDLFTYKDCKREVDASGLLRGHVPNFHPLVFGEVDWVGALSDSVGILVRLKCPTNASDSAKTEFSTQLDAMALIIAQERVETGGFTESSWLGGQINADGEKVFELNGKPGCFSVGFPYDGFVDAGEVKSDMKVGSVVSIMVSLSRFDRTHEGALIRRYSMRGHFYENHD